MGLLSTIRHPREWNYERVRRSIAVKWLRGSGIELGALHRPFPVPPGVEVKYVDHLTTDELRVEYPELRDVRLVHVDIRDDGETLATIADQSCDFVVASHFLEHCEDPLNTMQNHVRVIRPGGVVLLALPDRRHGVDRYRPPTSLEHMHRDHDAGPHVSRRQHYREWAELVDLRLGNISPEQVDAHAEELESRRYSIHFHCWTDYEFRDQLESVINELDLPVRVMESRPNYHEFLVAIRRRDADPA